MHANHVNTLQRTREAKVESQCRKLEAESEAGMLNIISSIYF